MQFTREFCKSERNSGTAQMEEAFGVEIVSWEDTLLQQDKLTVKDLKSRYRSNGEDRLRLLQLQGLNL